MSNPNDVEIKPEANGCIEIKCRYYNKNNDFVKRKILDKFMNVIRCLLAWNTSLDYHLSGPTKNHSITVKLDVLSNDDIKSTEKLIKKKITEIKKYLENDVNYDKLTKDMKITLASVLRFKIDFSKVLYIRSNFTNESIPINLKKMPIKPLIINSYKFQKDEVCEIINPYITESLICVDASRPYCDMSFDYNCLHLYEHLLCSPWTMEETKSSIKTLNGFTTRFGLCCVFCFAEDQNSFEHLFMKELEFIYQSRDENFWKSHEKNIELETRRTISETKHEPWLHIFARSSGNAFNIDYNTKIFEYWSNQPFKITIIHPYSKFNINDMGIDKLSIQHSIRAIERPPTPKFKYYPYYLTMIANYQKCFTRHVSNDEIKEIFRKYIFEDKITSGEFGVDVWAKDKFDVEDEETGKNIFVSMRCFIPIYLISTVRDLFPSEIHQQIIIRMFLSYVRDDLYNLFSADSIEY